MSLSESDRKFIDDNLDDYGSIWSEGLAGLERDFEVDAAVKWRKYVLKLALREPSGFRATLTLTKGDGDLSGGSVSVPDGPELSAEELGEAEAALEREGSVLVLEPLNGECLRLDLREGCKGLRGAPLDLSSYLDEKGKEMSRSARSLVTRRRGEYACLYFLAESAWDDPFCMWLHIDGDAMTVAGAGWGDVPAAKGQLLDRETFAFIDGAMRRNGDFGVYGSVVGGLVSLLDDMQVKLTFQDGGATGEAPCWWVNATPRDGYGHFLNFQIDAESGAIDGAMAGHLEPCPELEPEPLP
ncbi:MAG: hypothetical protein DRJ42_11745 [Deltaproteobacteria bacterium]|nr:MAG: hypothetical protein DRJ42_11745 [Deltaproteobacteria bacterium]